MSSDDEKEHNRLRWLGPTPVVSHGGEPTSRQPARVSHAVSRCPVEPARVPSPANEGDGTNSESTSTTDDVMRVGNWKTSKDLAPSVSSAEPSRWQEAVHHLSREAVSVAGDLTDLQRRLRTRKALFAVSFTVFGVLVIPTAFGGFPDFSLLALLGALVAFTAYLWTELVLDASLPTQLLTDWNTHLRQVRKLSFLSPPSGPLSQAGALDAIELNVQADGLRLRSAAFVDNACPRNDFFEPPSVVADG